jgi:hypothetical protein
MLDSRPSYEALHIPGVSSAIPNWNGLSLASE